MRTLRIISHGVSPIVLTVLTIVLTTLPGLAQANVTTWHNDNGRTGQNTNEIALTTSNVNKTHFGRLCTFTTHGQVYAQPLVIAHATDNGMDVYVADMQDYLYKFTIPASWAASCPAVVSVMHPPKLDRKGLGFC
jgi:hypothetical protein